MAETAVVARLKAVLTGDSAGLRRDLDQSEKRLKKFGDNATRLGRSMTTRLTLPIVGVGAAAVKTAAVFIRVIPDHGAIRDCFASEQTTADA